jgi:hypothetical protein
MGKEYYNEALETTLSVCLFAVVPDKINSIIYIRNNPYNIAAIFEKRKMKQKIPGLQPGI